MATVAELAEQVYRDYLLPADDQPVVLLLDGAVARDATTLGFLADTVAPDELDMLAPGVLIEAQSGELMLVRDVDLDTSQVTVLRGYRGTESEALADGSVLTVAPLFPRASVLDAVKDEVVGLWPDLYRTRTIQITTSLEPISVPADVQTPVDLMVMYGMTPLHETADLLSHYPPSPTGKAIVMRRPLDGWTAWFTYRARFSRPENATDDVTWSGVEPEWDRIVKVGAAMRAIAGRDADQMSSEWITEALERESLPSDAPRGVRDGLLQLRAIWLDQAARDLRARDPHPVVHAPFFGKP